MKTPITWLAAVLAIVLPVSAQAHKAWLLPSQTVLSAQDPWITVDAAVSNDLFYFNHVPLRLDHLLITAPDGSHVAPANAATGKFKRSDFGITYGLPAPGTNMGVFDDVEVIIETEFTSKPAA